MNSELENMWNVAVVAQFDVQTQLNNELKRLWKEVVVAQF
jgi:hypothetical protein